MFSLLLAPALYYIGSNAEESKFWAERAEQKETEELIRETEKKDQPNYSWELQNFKIWQIFTNRWQQEIIYDHIEIDSLQWDRPEITVNISQTTTTGNNPVTTYACSSFPAATTPSGETGDSEVFSRGVAQTLECYREASLPIPFSVVFDVGEALGGFIETDGPLTRILLLDSPTPDPDGLPNDAIEVSPGIFESPTIVTLILLNLVKDISKYFLSYLLQQHLLT